MIFLLKLLIELEHVHEVTLMERGWSRRGGTATIGYGYGRGASVEGGAGSA
jgi:hypothetical protein